MLSPDNKAKIKVQNLLPKLITEDYELDFYAFPFKQSETQTQPRRYRLLVRPKKGDMTKAFAETEEKLFRINNLIDYLSGNELLETFKTETFNNYRLRGNIAEIPKGGNGFGQIQITNSLYELFEKLNYSYMPAAELANLRKRNYVTTEDWNNRVTRKIAIASILLTALGLLLTQINSCRQQKMEIIMSPSTLDSIFKRANSEHRTSIDRTNEMPTFDTLSANSSGDTFRVRADLAAPDSAWTNRLSQ